METEICEEIIHTMVLVKSYFVIVVSFGYTRKSKIVKKKQTKTTVTTYFKSSPAHCVVTFSK